MKSQIFHTPTPSDLSAILRDIAEKQGWKNPLRDQLHEIADYVWSYNRAVNAHEELLTALKCLVNGNEPYSGCNLERARQAIAKAEGK